MASRRIATLITALTAAALLPAATAGAQDEPLGQPAGWAVEEPVTLVGVVSGSELFREPDPAAMELLAMDKEAFFAGEAHRNYLMSALWVRFLLSDPDSELARGFRGFLASVAGGGSPDAEDLRSRLGRSWELLPQDFRGWRVVQRARIGL